MDHQEPEPLFSIIHHFQKEHIEGSVGNWYGFKTTNAITFGQDLGDIMSAKLSASFHPKNDMAWHPWTTRSQKHSSASFIRPIWRTLMGLEAAGLV
jgi:hypothetical protein